MDKNAPLLKLWFYALSIAFFLIVGYCGYALLHYSNANLVSGVYSESLKQAIIKNDAIRPGKKSIVVFGSSLAKCALPFVSQIEKKVSGANTQAVILRVSIAALDMKAAECSGFFSYIVTYPPDYLFIENNNLNIDNGYSRENISFAVGILNDHILTKLKKMVGSKVADFNTSPVVGGGFFSDQSEMPNYKEVSLAKRQVRKFSDNKIANAAYVKLIKHGTKICFLEFPRSPKLDSIFLDNTGKNKMNSLLQSYTQTFAINCWKCPQYMANTDFQDGGHLNYKGAKKYAEWFVAKFNALK